MIWLTVTPDQVGYERIGSLFTWGGKEYIINQAFKDINSQTNLPTGNIILELDERTPPEAAGPTDK